jgi:hypothetical protein
MTLLKVLSLRKQRKKKGWFKMADSKGTIVQKNTTIGNSISDLLGTVKENFSEVVEIAQQAQELGSIFSTSKSGNTPDSEVASSKQTASKPIVGTPNVGTGDIVTQLKLKQNMLIFGGLFVLAGIVIFKVSK